MLDVDRRSRTKEALAEAGYNMPAVLTIRDILEHWEEAGQVAKEKFEVTRDFLSAPGWTLRDRSHHLDKFILEGDTVKFII